MEKIIVSALGSYLIGSIPTAYLLGKIKKIDIRKHGSGNVGATNVARILGKRVAALVLVIDIIKGFLAVFCSRLWFEAGDSVEWINSHSYIYLMLLSGAFVVLGHIYPVWLKFKGGKGVATAAGILLALSPFQVLIGLGVFLASVSLSKIVSLSSMLAVMSLPFTYFFFFDFQHDAELFYFLLSLALFIVVKHRSNIVRIYHGTESKIGTFAR